MSSCYFSPVSHYTRCRVLVVDKSADHAKPHLICFLPQFQRQRKCFFRALGRARAENGIT